MINQDDMRIYMAIGNFATENLFWQLIYLNNAAFHTPIQSGAKEKLMSMGRTYDTIISSFYPSGEAKALVSAMANNNRLFVSYVDCVMQGGSQTNMLKQQWKENGQKIATLLCRLNSYWQATEWTAMINHECDLLDTIASSMHAKNYAAFFNTAPICKRLAIDMSSYMSGGLAKQLQAPCQ